MASSRYLAGILGPTLCVLSLTEGFHLSIWENASPTLVYLNGLMLFVAGLSILRAHWLWVRDWPVLITLVGCVGLLLGLYRMWAPKAPQAGAYPATYAVLVVIFTVGLVLCLKGYGKN